SLIIADESGGAMRYRMLDALRGIFSEHLQPDEMQVLRQRHSEFYLRVAATANEHVRGPSATEWLNRLDVEIDNIRASLAWCRSDKSRVYAGLRMAYLLRDFWNVRGHLKEGYRWLTDLMKEVSDVPAAAADIADEARAEGHRA